MRLAYSGRGLRGRRSRRGVPGCRGAGLGFGPCIIWKGMAWKAFQVRGAGAPGCESRVWGLRVPEGDGVKGVPGKGCWVGVAMLACH